MDTPYFINSAQLPWKDNSYVTVKTRGGKLVEIIANREGLLSLAKHLEMLADAQYYNIHYETELRTAGGCCQGDLEEGSMELSVTKDERDGRKRQ